MAFQLMVPLFVDRTLQMQFNPQQWSWCLVLVDILQTLSGTFKNILNSVQWFV